MAADAGRRMQRGYRTRPAAGVGHGGFTLLEILLAVALLAILSAALVTVTVRLTDTKPTTPSAIFWEAVSEARKSALRHEHDVQLSFDDKEKQFTIGDGEKTFPVPNAHDLSINFLQVQSDRTGLILLAGQVVDTKTIPYVTFYTDGTCSPFRLQIHGTGAAQIIAIDPWTCAPVLTPSDSTNP